MVAALAKFLGIDKIFVKLGLGLFTLLALGFAIWRVIVWYDNQLDDAFNKGEASAYAKVIERTAATAAKLNSRAAELRGRANAQTDDVTDAAADLRLSGPGKAACPAADPIGSSIGYQPPVAQTGNSVGSVHPPGGSNLAAVPWDDLVTVVEQHDKLLVDAVVCRQFFEDYSKILATNQK